MLHSAATVTKSVFALICVWIWTYLAVGVANVAEVEAEDAVPESKTIQTISPKLNI